MNVRHRWALAMAVTGAVMIGVGLYFFLQDL